MSEWIKVTEKLPDIYDYVLVLCSCPGQDEPQPVGIARLVPDDEEKKWELLHEDEGGDGTGAFQDIEYYMTKSYITHWMPIPPLKR